MDLTEKLKQAIKNGELEISKLSPDILLLEGMSSPKVRHFLNNIIDQNSRYLEIGTWKGSTFISALYNNNPEYHVGIDNWQQFNSSNSVMKEFFDNCNRFLGYAPNFIQTDCFNISPIDFKIENINVYFYDGAHQELDQYNAVAHYYSSLANEFILIVDDYNDDFVVSGTKRAIYELKLIVKYEQILPAKRINASGNPFEWWNGLYVAHLQKDNNDI